MRERDRSFKRCLDAFDASVRGDHERAVDCVQAMLRTRQPTRELFAASMGWANIVATTAAEHSNGTGPLIAELQARDDADPRTSEIVANAAALIAAAGNEDGSGALTLWARLDADDMIGTAMALLNMAAAVGREQMQRRLS